MMTTGAVQGSNWIPNGHHVFLGSSALGVLLDECHSLSAPSHALGRDFSSSVKLREVNFWDSALGRSIRSSLKSCG